MTSTTAPALPANLVLGETFSHVAKGSRGSLSYPLTPVLYVHEDGTKETAGVLVAGEPHRLCKRCGEAFGFYSFNGEDSDCYECDRAAYGASDSLESLRSLARNRVMSRLRAAAKIAAAEAAHAALVAAWTAENADVVEALRPHLAPEWKAPTSFLAKMAEIVLSDRHFLTEGQTVAVRKVITDRAEAVVVECPEGRTVVEGKILSIKMVDDNFSYYGGQIAKAVVADDRGFRVYGTLPSSISGAEVGDRVRFTGTIERSAKDADFGFYKRPAKAEVLAA